MAKPRRGSAARAGFTRAKGPKTLLAPGDSFVEYADATGGAIVETIRRMDARGRISITTRRYHPVLDGAAWVNVRARARKATRALLGRRT